METTNSIPASQDGRLPREIAGVFLFAAFNALSFQIVLGSPMILYAKNLNASATVLGIITGMMPLLVIFQIPAASHVARVGYKRFVYAGWGTRVAFIFAVALIPLTGGFLGATTQLALLISLLFGFNLSRGISSAAWLPWITALVPLDVRSRYLAREAACVHVASCAALLLSAWWLEADARSWHFAILFGFSAVAGVISLGFLKRIPDVEVPTHEKTSVMPVPWLAIAGYGPFRQLLRLNIAWAIAYGGLGAFTVAYLKAEAGMTESSILIVTGLAFVGGLAGLGYFGSRTDRLGSKPVLTLSLLVWIVIMLGWFVVAARLVRPRIGLILLLEVTMGFAYALVNMNNTRLAMLLAPTMGRSHFFAMFSVVGNLTLGLAPVAWGLIIDAFGDRQWQWQGIELNRFSFFYLCVLLVFGLALALCLRLEEPAARKMDELITDLFRSPQRLWIRLWPRG